MTDPWRQEWMQWIPEKIERSRQNMTELGHTWSIGYGTVMECYGEECWLAIPLYLAYLARFWSCISDVDLIRFVVVSVSQYFSDFFHSHPFSSILIHSHPFSSILVHSHPFSSILQFLPSFSTDQTEQAYISLECDTSLYFGFDLPATASVNSPTNRLPRTQKLHEVTLLIRRFSCFANFVSRVQPFFTVFS